MKKLERAPSDLRGPGIKSLSFAIRDDVRILLQNANEDYLYWDKIKHQALPEGLAAEDFWLMVKAQRALSRNAIYFGSYTFHWNTNNRILEALHFFDLHIGGTIGSGGLISPEDRHRYLISSIMEEAIASSQIEGAVTTRQAAKEMLRSARKPANKSEQMIVNNYRTIEHILTIKNESLTLERLLAIHRLVTENTMPDAAEEGALRTDDSIAVYDTATGDVVHQPPSHTDIQQMLNDLFTFFNKDDPQRFVHPFIKASIIHFMIGFIHPFTDGNGRTARALFYWFLLRKGYWLTEHLSISRLILRAKAQYARAYQYVEIDEHDLTYFLLFNIKVMRSAFDELITYIQRKQEEKKQSRRFLGIGGVNQRQAQILEWFDREPDLLLTIREAQSRLATTHQTARTDLAHLADQRFLTVFQLDGKTKAFRRGDAFPKVIESAGS